SAGDYTDNASVSSNTSDNNLANNSASATTTVTPPADLEMLTKTASSATVTVPSQITYTLIGRNNGPNASSGVFFTDTLPAGTTFAGGSAGCTETSSGVVTCDLGTVASGDSVSATIVVNTTAASSPGTATN